MPCLFLTGCALTPFLLFGWAQWLRRHTKAPRYASRIGYALVGLVLLMPLGAVLVLYGALSRESADPLGPAQIVEPPDVDASFLAETLLPVVVTVLWLLFATWRWHWAARGPVMPRERPYR